MIEKYYVSLKKLLQQGISNPEFYGDLVYKIKTKFGNPNFSDLFKNLVNRFKKVGFELNIMHQTAFLVFNGLLVDSNAVLFSCTAVDQVADSLMASI